MASVNSLQSIYPSVARNKVNFSKNMFSTILFCFPMHVFGLAKISKMEISDVHLRFSSRVKPRGIMEQRAQRLCGTGWQSSQPLAKAQNSQLLSQGQSSQLLLQAQNSQRLSQVPSSQSLSQAHTSLVLPQVQNSQSLSQVQTRPPMLPQINQLLRMPQPESQRFCELPRQPLLHTYTATSQTRQSTQVANYAGIHPYPVQTHPLVRNWHSGC